MVRVFDKLIHRHEEVLERMEGVWMSDHVRWSGHGVSVISLTWSALTDPAVSSVYIAQDNWRCEVVWSVWDFSDNTDIHFVHDTVAYPLPSTLYPHQFDLLLDGLQVGLNRDLYQALHLLIRSFIHPSMLEGDA